MNLKHTIITKTLSLAAVGIAMAGAVMVNAPETVAMTQDHAPTISQVPKSILLEQVAAGRTCDEEPTLTDTIIFTYENGTTKVITFDQALADAKASKGTVRLYCSDAR